MHKYKVGDTLFLKSFRSNLPSKTAKIVKIGPKFAHLEGISGKIILEKMEHDDKGFSYYWVYESEAAYLDIAKKERIYKIIVSELTNSNTPKKSISLVDYIEVARLLKIDIKDKTD